MFTKTIPLSWVTLITFASISAKDIVHSPTINSKKTDIQILRHPLASHLLTQLRDVKTKPDLFRQCANKLTTLLVLEATQSLKTKKIKIETPIEKTETEVLENGLAFISILRAGLSMIEPAIQLFPDVVIGHIGMERDEITSQAKKYYCKLPKLVNKNVFCFDPMLATGGSASQVIKILKEHGASHVTMVCVIAAPEGIKRLQTDHPDIKIIVASIDKKLNDKNYIIPGLGDFGDRLYGTL